MTQSKTPEKLSINLESNEDLKNLYNLCLAKGTHLLTVLGNDIYEDKFQIAYEVEMGPKREDKKTIYILGFSKSKIKSIANAIYQ